MKRLGTLLGAIIFLFVISTGAWAAPPAKDVNCDLPCINSFEIEDGAVDTADIADGAVTNAKVTGPISRGNLETASNVVVVAQSGGDFATISAALAAITPSAANPYVIDVMPGTYTENVTMKSYVHLRGAGRDVTTIQPSSGNVITLNSLTDVTVSGLTISGGKDGIFCDSTSVTITNNTFTGVSDEGVDMRNCSSVITGNIFDGNGYGGIYNNSAGDGAVITQNIFRNNGVIALRNDSHATIEGNTFSGNDYGIYMYVGSGTVTGNNFDGNLSYGMYIENSPSLVISGNTVTTSGVGLDISDSAITISGNTIIGNTTGLYTWGASPQMILHNRITGNTTTDIAMWNSPHVSYNVYDTTSGSATPVGAYNLKSNGTAW